MTQQQIIWAAFLGGAFIGMMVLIGIILSNRSTEEEDSHEHA